MAKCSHAPFGARSIPDMPCMKNVATGGVEGAAIYGGSLFA